MQKQARCKQQASNHLQVRRWRSGDVFSDDGDNDDDGGDQHNHDIGDDDNDGDQHDHNIGGAGWAFGMAVYDAMRGTSAELPNPMTPLEQAWLNSCDSG